MTLHFLNGVANDAESTQKSIFTPDSFFCVCFVALRPKSTAMAMAARSVHLTTHFSLAGLNKRLTSNSDTHL